MMLLRTEWFQSRVFKQIIITKAYLRSSAKCHSISQGKHKLCLTLSWILHSALKHQVFNKSHGARAFRNTFKSSSTLLYHLFTEPFKFWDKDFFSTFAQKQTWKNISQKGDNRKKYMPLKMFSNKTKSVILIMYAALPMVRSHITEIYLDLSSHTTCILCLYRYKKCNTFIHKRNS